MALGAEVATATISTNTDTSVIAAPGLKERIYILWISVTVGTAGTASRLHIEDGAGGTSIARMATATADAELFRNYTTGHQGLPGRPLTENAALNFETTGSGAATINVEVGYVVKGG